MTKLYRSFLLRMWQIDEDDPPAWRATLEDPTTRQVTGFDSLEALCIFLMRQKNGAEQTEKALGQNQSQAA